MIQRLRHLAFAARAGYGFAVEAFRHMEHARRVSRFSRPGDELTVTTAATFRL